MGICFTTAIALLTPYYSKPFVMIPVYLLRCGFMWSTGGLSYSIIADYVPKEYRARWNTLESISSFGWSGSALLGGKLVQAYDYEITFAITASIQLLAVILFYFPITPLVAHESDIQDLVQEKLKNEMKEPLLDEESRDNVRR